MVGTVKTEVLEANTENGVKRREAGTVRESCRVVKRRKVEVKQERVDEQSVDATQSVEGTVCEHRCGAAVSDNATVSKYHVPPLMVCPAKERLDVSDEHELIVFDLETTGLGWDAKICQIAAIGAKTGGREWSTYMLPHSDFQPVAAFLTGLEVRVVNGERCLMKQGERVDTVSPEDGLLSFRSFLESHATAGRGVVLIAHNAEVFDANLLLRGFFKCGILAPDLVKRGLVGFADSLQLLRDLKKREHPSLLKDGVPIDSLSLGSVYQFLYDNTLTGHDAVEDAAALRRILFDSLGITAKQMLAYSITTLSASQRDAFRAKKQLLLRSMKNKLYYSPMYEPGPISQYMANKIAESGLGYSDLESIFAKFGRDGIFAVLRCPVPCDGGGGSRPRVTKFSCIADPG